MDDRYVALYNRLLQTPFPDRSGDDRVDELYANLHLVDSFVAEGAISAKAGRGLPDWYADVLSDIDELDRRIHSLMPVVSAGDLRILESYSSRLAVLREVQAALRDQATSPD